MSEDQTHDRRYALLLPKLINERDTNPALQVRVPQTIKSILRDVLPAHCDLQPIPVLVLELPPRHDIAVDEAAEHLHSRGERNGERYVVEDSQPGSEAGDLSRGGGARRARRYLLFFEAVY